MELAREKRDSFLMGLLGYPDSYKVSTDTDVFREPFHFQEQGITVCDLFYETSLIFSRCPQDVSLQQSVY